MPGGPRQGTDVPCGDPVHRVRVVGDVDAPIRQLSTESYRPRTGCPRWLGQLREPLPKRPRSGDQRLPETLSPWRVERGEDLPPASVEHGQGGAVSLFGNRAAERVEAADAGGRDARAGRQAEGRRQPDPDPDEGAGPAPDRDPPHLPPASARLRRTLHLGEQGGRVAGATVGRQAERRLVQHLAAAYGADRGVSGRRVETDDRPLLGAQLSQ